MKEKTFMKGKKKMKVKNFSLGENVKISLKAINNGIKNPGNHSHLTLFVNGQNMGYFHLSVSELTNIIHFHKFVKNFENENNYTVVMGNYKNE